MNTNDQSAKTILMYAIALLAVIISAIIIAGFIILIPNRGDAYSKTINVQGTGEVFATPTIADFSFRVREEAKDVTTAQKQASEKVAIVLGALEKLSIPKEDIKTEVLSSNPRYEWHEDKAVVCVAGQACPAPESKRVIVGYEYAQTVTITLRDLAKSGDVLQILGSSDVSDMFGPNLRVEDTDALRAEAREEAITKARAQAEATAKSLGVRLGKMTSFYEDNNGGYPMPYASGGMEYAVADSVMMKSAPVPEVPVGQNKITTTVNITYKIK